MARISIPPGEGSEVDRIWALRPELGRLAKALQAEIFGPNMTLSVRELEAIRMRVSIVNGCPVCMAWRAPSSARHGLTKEFFDSLVDFRDHPELYSAREALAIEYAERFGLDHAGVDVDLFDRLKEHFDDGEILEMTLVMARHLAFSRLSAVLHLEDVCMLNVAGDLNYGAQTSAGAYDF